MFGVLGRSVSRFWHLYLAVWLAVAVAGWAFAPAWETVTRSGEVGFLPKNAPSRLADELFQQTFPLDYSASSVALVLVRDNDKLTLADREFVEKSIVPKLTDIAGRPNSPISTVRTYLQPGINALLTSADGRATLVIVELTTPFQDRRNEEVIADIEEFVASAKRSGAIPSGLTVSVTGSATAGRDLDEAEAGGAHAIERWTIIITVGLLVGLYRAPLVAFIPLITVAVAVHVAMSMLAIVAGLKIFIPSRDLRVFITVLVYGGGVDYCLFLIARYREEMEAGRTPSEAIALAIDRVGHAIFASAGTTIGGIGMLYFAQFGKIHEAGLVIPIALTVAFLGTLTFASPLLLWCGKQSFWPHGIVIGADADQSRIWDRLGPILSRRPGLIWMGAVLVIAPMAWVGVLRHDDQNFNPLSDLPDDVPSRAGAAEVRRNFSDGILGPITILIDSGRIDFASKQGFEVIREVADRLEARAPEFGVNDVRSLARPLGITENARENLARLRADRNDAENLVREQSGRYYLGQSSQPGHTITRIDVTLDVDPLGREGIRRLRALQDGFPAMLPESLADARVAFVGPASTILDLGDVKRDDQELVQMLVSIVVFVMLVLTLWRFVLSLYLILSVLFSYLATLGLSDLVFRALSDGSFAGLDWKVPIFLFTILVAVGVDYNIFLLTRVKEENQTRDPEDAVVHALARTGRVISSCGFVMAGTFAALLSSPLHAMKQLGFALSIGVLLDTLVVRPILVPTFLILIQRAFPGRLGRFMSLGRWSDAKPNADPAVLARQ